MPKIRVELERNESYALLVATEFLRRLRDERGGIPLVTSLETMRDNPEYYRLDVGFIKDGIGFIAECILKVGDPWPKNGGVYLTRVGGGTVSKPVYEFKLTGSPSRPGVRFRKPRG